MNPDKKLKLRAKDKVSRSFRRQAPYRVAEIEQAAAAGQVEQQRQPDDLRNILQPSRLVVVAGGEQVARRIVSLVPSASPSPGPRGGIFERLGEPTTTSTTTRGRAQSVSCPAQPRYKSQSTQTDPPARVVTIDQEVQTDSRSIAPALDEEYVQVLARVSETVSSS